jgi:hypothetical protein
MRNYHELGECRLSEESIVCRLAVCYLELQVLNTEVFLSPKSHGKSNLTHGGRCYTRDYAMK